MISINGKFLKVKEKSIELEYTIKKVIEFENAIIVLVYDDVVIPNNVIAFDYCGNKLWQVNDILCIPQPKGNVDIEKASTNILDVYSSLSILFEIDINKRELVNKIYLR